MGWGAGGGEAKGSNVFDENPPGRQKLAAEGPKARFCDSISSVAVYQFILLSEQFSVGGGFVFDQKVIRKVSPPARVSMRRGCYGKSTQNGSTSLQFEPISQQNFISSAPQHSYKYPFAPWTIFSFSFPSEMKIIFGMREGGRMLSFPFRRYRTWYNGFPSWEYLMHHKFSANFSSRW